MALVTAPATPTGFGRTLWRASRRKVAVFLLTAVATLGVAAGSALGHAPLDGSRIYLDAPQYVGGGVDTLIRAHDCWTGTPPAGAAAPGHVVVSRNGGAAYLGGERDTLLALDQLFGKKQHGLVVYAFCR
jgi:hypothetical protein